MSRQMLGAAMEAARSAGHAIAERYLGDREVTVKGYRDVVTEVDYVAERIVIDLIRSRFPSHAIISEEAGGDLADAGYTWVIDPLDGTTNYSRRLPVCAVSVGVLEQGEPLIGVIYDPLLDHMFVAERGQGAELNGTRLHVSQVGALIGTVVALDWGHADDVRQQSLAYLGRIAPLCGTVRAFGSATLALAYVAAGWLDAYLNLALKPWDAAAGMALITEAGGRCTTLDGEPYCVAKPACLASNGLLHDQLLACLGHAD